MKVEIAYDAAFEGHVVYKYDNTEDVTVEDGFVIITLPKRIVSIPVARVFYVEVERG